MTNSLHILTLLLIASQITVQCIPMFNIMLRLKSAAKATTQTEFNRENDHVEQTRRAQEPEEERLIDDRAELQERWFNELMRQLHEDDGDRMEEDTEASRIPKYDPMSRSAHLSKSLLSKSSRSHEQSGVMSSCHRSLRGSSHNPGHNEQFSLDDGNCSNESSDSEASRKSSIVEEDYHRVSHDDEEVLTYHKTPIQENTGTPRSLLTRSALHRYDKANV